MDIKFISHSDVPYYYSAADIVILPYRKIYQSGVLMMSLSYKKPVVVSDLPSFKGGWYWTVDDVVIEEVPDNGLECTNETFGGWWVGYQSLGDIGIDYTLYPMAQATANPYRMEAVISNTGVNTQNNVTLHVDVEEPSGNINSYMSSPSNLVGAPNPMNDTTATTANFSPSSMGVSILNSRIN